MTIRSAVAGDVPLILGLVRELAAYERLADQVVATEADFARTLFGEPKRAYAVIAEADGAPVGFGLYFFNFSTFLGRPGLYIEDVYVRPDHRSRGIGRAIFRHLAQVAVEQGCGRMEWWVLDWNAPAIRFYQALGAEPMTDWTVQRLTGDALRNLARS